MFYGAFLALLYVATGRFSFPLIGLILFAAGAWFVAGHVAHVHARVLAWEHPLDPALYNQPGGSYQLAQSLFAQADGGLLGTGFDQSLLQYPVELTNHTVVHRSILPVPESNRSTRSSPTSSASSAPPACCSSTCCSSRAV